MKAVIVLLLFVGVIAGCFSLLGRQQPSQCRQPSSIPAAPAGYPERVVDCAGKVYFVKAWNFDDKHQCIIFQDSNANRQMVCGNYKLESSSNLIN